MSRSVVDMMGRAVVIPDRPQRIISLVPSQTEYLFSLGLKRQIVGVTRFCVHPEEARRHARVIGGTKQLKIERCLRLKPDLVIGNKEENDAESIEALSAQVPTWMSEIYTLSDARKMMRQTGTLVGKEEEANQIITEIDSAFDRWRQRRPVHRPRVLYLIWRNPWMGAAASTFIDQMLLEAGFDNVLKEKQRYPMLDNVAIRDLRPDLILLSSEPYPFKDVHREELLDIAPGARIYHVDGELFSWYGNRLALAPDYFEALWSSLGE